MTEDFDLPTSTAIGSKTATIAWTITSEYSQFIKVNDAGNKCLVTPSSLDPEVRIRAKFSYDGEETTMIYRFKVSIEKTPLESIDYWYNNTGVSVDMSGWIVAIATEYSESYKNITFYMVDENLYGGYYLYRCSVADKDVGNGLKIGSYVKVTNTTNTNYNGLVETNAGGSLTIDATKNKTEAQMKELCYALDNDILGKVPEAIYHTSQYVSLENWEITSEIKPNTTYGTTDTFFTIKKNNIEVKVNASKYLEGIYKAATDKNFTDIVAKVNTLGKGDLINIKGILGNNKGYTLMPIYAEDIVKNEKGADSADAIKALPGVIVGNFISASKTGLNAVIDAAGLNLIVTKAKEVQLPASSDDVTVVYSILGESDVITLDKANSKLIIAAIPDGQHERVHLQIDLTCGTYKTTVFQYVEIWGKSDKDMVDDEHLQLFIDDIKVPGQVNLPIVGSIYGSNVSSLWELAEESELASIVTNRNFQTQA
ncbi:MAG: hypothetical protein K2L37_01865, partial [Lactobacillus sp.]|nr:hypothetical protein [Lactobacillus sp.]